MPKFMRNFTLTTHKDRWD